ncbi:MAG: FG-GAP repeat protein [Phycisphaerales bacterium]|nr:FG-GAP repeat protein [Phycisphaerales bacterium]
MTPRALPLAIAALLTPVGAAFADERPPRSTLWRQNLIPHDPADAVGFGSPLQTGRNWVIAADVDGDGADDLVIGAPECQLVDCAGSAASGPLGVRRAVVLVISGRTGGLLRELASPTPSAQGTGLNLGSFGTQLAAADLNGDGRAEIAVSAPFENVDLNGDGVNEFSVGAVSVFDGATGALLHRIVGDTPGRSFGYSSCYVGDWTGDGVRDLLITTRPVFQGGDYIGSLRLHSGADGSRVASTTFTGDVVAAAVHIVNVGDTDGDGFDDAALTTRAGPPGPPLLTVVTSAALDLANAFVVSDSLGKPPAPFVGDLDGDGLADIALWRQFFNGTDFVASLELVSPESGDVIRTIDIPPRSNTPPVIVSLGDVNADGAPEVVIGPFPVSIGGQPPATEDRALVVSLADGSVLETLFTLDPSGDGDSANTRLAHTYTSMVVGDFDGDGAPDLAAVGVPVNQSQPPLHLRQINIFRRPGCPEDLNADARIGFADLAILIDQFNDSADAGEIPADLDGDGLVGFGDLSLLLGRFNSGC